MKNWLLAILVLNMFFLFQISIYGNDKTIEIADSLAVKLRKNNKADINRVNALDYVVKAFFKHKEYQRSKPYINEIIDLSEEINTNYVKALGDFYQGTLLLTENNYREALPYLLRAEYLSSLLHESKENNRLKIRIYSSLSVCYFKSQMFKEYYVNIQKGLKLNKDLRDMDLEFALNSNLAVTYFYLGNDSAAIEIDKMLITDPAFINQNMFYPYFHLGAFHENLQNYDSAVYYYNKAFSFVSLAEDAAWVFVKLGEIYNARQDYRSAITILTRCLDTLPESGNAELEASAYIELGYSYYKLQQPDTATCFVDKGIYKAHQYNYLELEVEGLGILKNLLYDKGNYKEFSDVILEYNSLKDSLITINNIMKMSELVFQNKINEEKKLIEYNQYMLETKHRQQMMIVYLILLLLISAIIVILLLLNRKNILIKNRKVQQEFLSNELDLRNREITARVLLQVKMKEMLSDIIKKLSDIVYNKGTSKNIQSIIVDLKKSLEDKSQEDFDYYFVQTHPDFYNKLKTDFPELTPYELRLCAYLKMNLNTKDIASISNISPDSARTARSRLRKTLNISNHNESLFNFLSKY